MIILYLAPACQRYNEGLVHITRPGLGKGPIIAKGAGHLIHKDKPLFVAEELSEILRKLKRDEASRM